MLQAARELGDGLLEDLLAEKGLEPEGLAEIDAIDGARHRIRTLVTADATFLPAYAPSDMLEFALGGDSVDLGGFALRGRVDRVDRGPGGLVVQDYKWGTGCG